MSFWPLARTSTERLRVAASRAPLLELGAGDGRFTRRITELGLPCLSLDRRYPPTPPDLNALAGDALRLPLRDSCLGGVLVPNLLRQLAPDTYPAFATESMRVLQEGGVLLILEDHHEARTPAETNYRSALDLLARALPERGTPTLIQSEVELALEDLLGLPYDQGVHENSEAFLRPTAPLDWLEANSLIPPDEIQELREGVENHGMSYGRYWSLVYLKPGDALS